MFARRRALAAAKPLPTDPGGPQGPAASGHGAGACAPLQTSFRAALKEFGPLSSSGHTALKYHPLRG
jgi:hypothetical protein